MINFVAAEFYKYGFGFVIGREDTLKAFSLHPFAFRQAEKVQKRWCDIDVADGTFENLTGFCVAGPSYHKRNARDFVIQARPLGEQAMRGNGVSVIGGVEDESVFRAFVDFLDYAADFAVDKGITAEKMPESVAAQRFR